MTHSRRFVRFARLSLLLFGICLCLACLLPARAYAEGSRGIDEILGVNRETFVANMNANQSRYLGTPYTYFADRMDGPGQHMDCSAFVGFALIEQGGVSETLWRSYAISGEASVGYPGTESIDQMFRNQGAACKTFGTVADVLASGYATKGDIIFVWPREFGDAPQNGGRSHVGFFWGDTPSDNKMWHSTHSDGLSGNVISDIRGKVGGDLYYRVYKTTSTGNIDLTKTSANTAFSNNNQAYSLAGAVFGVFKQDGTEVCRITTDAQGHGRAEHLAFGTYIVRELQAPPGYERDSTDRTVTVDETDANVIVEDKPATLNVTVQKTDRETGLPSPLGGASLAGAKYRITYPWDGATKSEEIETDAQGAAYLNGIPLGTVQVQEIAAPRGYLLDPGVRTYSVSGSTDGAAIYELTTVKDTSDQVIRGDIELLKIGSPSHERLANVPFRITSTTTNESHILVTDANGYASTSSTWNLHGQSANAGTAATDGIWFGTDRPDEGLGALPFDSYTIEELPCEANKNKVLIPAFTVTVSRNAHIVDLGTLSDEGLPYVTVRKVDAATGNQLAGAQLELQRRDGDEWASVAAFESQEKAFEQHLLTGRYRLVETDAPRGYVRAEPVEFELTSGTREMTVEMIDERTHLSLSKIAMGSGKELPGASMQLFDSAGNLVEAWTSGSEPHVIDGLEPGSYTLREDAAPAGYDIATDIPFTLEETAAVQTCVMSDKETPGAQGLPKTIDQLKGFLPVFAMIAGATTFSVLRARKVLHRERQRQRFLDSLMR